MTSRYEIKKISEGYINIIGCDEVGRGCLAGPVVATAVVFSFENRPKWFADIKDSKQLLPAKREYLSKLIKSESVWSIAEVPPEVVDEINIHNASLLAMHRAVDGLTLGVIPESRPEDNLSAMFGIHLKQGSGSRLGGRDDTLRYFLAVDGKFKVPNLAMNQEAIIAGDNKVLSIAAASIIAKVYRDGLMAKLHKTFPVYNFARHKGYATEHHRKMVIRHGLSPIHRLSFCQKLSA